MEYYSSEYYYNYNYNYEQESQNLYSQQQAVAAQPPSELQQQLAAATTTITTEAQNINYQQQQYTYHHNHNHNHNHNPPVGVVPYYDCSAASNYHYSSSSSYYYPQQQQQQYEGEEATHPPGVPIQPDPTPSLDSHLQQTQTLSYPAPPPPQYQFNQTAANTQIAQFTYIHAPQTPLHYHAPQPNGHASSLYHQASSQLFTQHDGPSHSVLPTLNGGSPSLSNPPLGTKVQPPYWRPPPRMAWCELCRVDCNTREILEQHKKGKQHRKNLQIQEELKNINKIIIAQQNILPRQESLPIATLTNGNSIATEQPNESGQVGRAAKFVKTNKGSRKPAGPTKQKEAIPFVCELCNSKCESQVVFDSHLAGKKHRANLEQFHRDRAMYGEPPNVNDISYSSTNQMLPSVDAPPLMIGTSLPGQSLSADCQVPPAQQRGSKRKMSGIRGPMGMRFNKGSRKPAGPSKPKEVIPFVCELCNAKCETQLVFNSHLAGKKHKLNLTKFHSNEESSGPPNLNGKLSSSSNEEQQKVVDGIVHRLPTDVAPQPEEQAASASNLAQAQESTAVFRI